MQFELQAAAFSSCRRYGMCLPSPDNIPPQPIILRLCTACLCTSSLYLHFELLGGTALCMPIIKVLYINEEMLILTESNYCPLGVPHHSSNGGVAFAVEQHSNCAHGATPQANDGTWVLFANVLH